MSYPIICLAGKGGVGKDHVADLIVKNTKNACKIALADEIKNQLISVGFDQKYLYGKSENRKKTIPGSKSLKFWRSVYEKCCLYDYDTDIGGLYLEQFINAEMSKSFKVKGVSGRSILQGYGSYARAHDKKIWINHAYSKIQDRLEHDRSLVVVPDLRLRNEILFFKALGAKIFLIESPQGGTIEGPFSKDISETELDSIPLDWFDKVIENDKTSEESFILRQLGF